MPSAIVVLLQTPAPPAGIHLRGWLYHALTPKFPNIHGQSPIRPFSIAFGRQDKDTSWARFAFLNDEMARYLTNELWQLRGRALKFGNKKTTVIEVFEYGHPFAGKKNWQKLLDCAPNSDLALEFITPTLFKKGDLHYPVPVPERILESLIRHWNAFAPEPITKSMKDALLQKATFRFLKAYTTTTQAHTLTPGFVGRATLHLPKATEEEARWLSRLGELAFFSGVGAKTTIGFGLTRKVAEDEKETRPHPDGRKN